MQPFWSVSGQSWGGRWRKSGWWSERDTVRLYRNTPDHNAPCLHPTPRTLCHISASMYLLTALSTLIQCSASFFLTIFSYVILSISRASTHSRHCTSEITLLHHITLSHLPRYSYWYHITPHHSLSNLPRNWCRTKLHHTHFHLPQYFTTIHYTLSHLPQYWYHTTRQYITLSQGSSSVPGPRLIWTHPYTRQSSVPSCKLKTARYDQLSCIGVGRDQTWTWNKQGALLSHLPQYWCNTTLRLSPRRFAEDRGSAHIESLRTRGRAQKTAR